LKKIISLFCRASCCIFSFSTQRCWKQIKRYTKRMVLLKHLKI